MHHLIVYEDGISTTWLNTEILLMCAETVAKHLPHLAAIGIISITIMNPDLATIDAIDILCLNVDYAFTRTCIGGTKLCACFVAQCKKPYKWPQDLLLNIQHQWKMKLHKCMLCAHTSYKKWLFKWHVMVHTMHKLYVCRRFPMVFKHAMQKWRHENHVLIHVV